VYFRILAGNVQELPCFGEGNINVRTDVIGIHLVIKACLFQLTMHFWRYTRKNDVNALLAFVFLAAWKAPAWVWKIGLLALVSGILFGILGYYQIQAAVQKTLLESGDIAPSVLMGGYKCMMIPVIYGFIIFIASLIINIFQSPRI
jgi:hypothetical protein